MKDDLYFGELAALHAFGDLEDFDFQMVEDRCAEFPEFEAELAACEETVAAIPYSAPPVPMAADLKDRLLQRIHISSPALSNPIAPSSPLPTSDSPLATVQQIANLMIRQVPGRKRVAVRADELIWQPYKVPGVTIAPLYIDLVKREVVAILRAEAGVSYPVHRHTAVEEIYMLEGDLVIGDEVYGAGDYIRSNPGSSHGPSTVGGCMFFVRTSMDDQYS